MKKISIFVTAFLFFITLLSCSNEKIYAPDDSSWDFTLLYSIKQSENSSAQSRAAAVKDGFLLFSETDSGSKASYIDIDNKTQIDSLIESNSKDFSRQTVFTTEESDFVTVIGNEFFVSSPVRKISDKRSFPDNYPKDVILYNDIAFIYTDAENGLCILEPYDFSQKYVLCKTDILQDRTTPISSSGKNIYFTQKSEWGYEGITVLKYGENTAQRISDEFFSEYTVLQNGNIVTKRGNVISMTDAEKATCTEYTFSREFKGFSASNDFSVFAGLFTENNKDYIEIIDVKADKSKVISLKDYTASPFIAVSSDAKYVLFTLTNPTGATREETVAYISVSEKLQSK